MSGDTSNYACPAGTDWNTVDVRSLRDRHSSVAVELEPWRWRHVAAVVTRAADAASDPAVAEELAAISGHIHSQIPARAGGDDGARAETAGGDGPTD